MESKGEGCEGTGEVTLICVVVDNFLLRNVRPGKDAARHNHSLSTYVCSREHMALDTLDIIWKCALPVFLAVLSDETTDIKESSATIIFAIALGSFPQKPDSQPTDSSYKKHAGDDESGDVKRSRGRTTPGSREDVNRLRCHERARDSGDRYERDEKPRKLMTIYVGFVIKERRV